MDDLTPAALAALDHLAAGVARPGIDPPHDPHVFSGRSLDRHGVPRVGLLFLLAAGLADVEADGLGLQWRLNATGADLVNVRRAFTMSDLVTA